MSGLDPTDPLALAKALLARESVTPAGGPVFDVAETALAAAGFTVARYRDGPDPVENLLAFRGGARPRLG